MKAAPRRIMAALLAMAILLAAGFSGARADDAAAPSLQKTLSDRYGSMRLAMAERNVEKVGAMLAPGFRSTALSGRAEDAAQMLRLMTEHLEQERPKIFTTSVEIVKQDGDRATVAQTYEMKTTQKRPDGAADLVRIVAFSIDTWLNKDGEWLLENTETNSADLYINEKLQKHVVREGAAPLASPAPAP